MRVVSLLPSATETLCAIDGGEALLVGRSHECDWPPAIAHLPALTAQKITATASAEIDAEVRAALDAPGIAQPSSLYTLDADALKALKPDVILTQDLCDVCSIDLETVHRLAQSLDSEPAILALNPVRLEDVFDDVLRVGEAVRLSAAAHRMMIDLRDRYWSAVDYVNPYIDGPEVAFLEWMDPLFGGGHWTPQLIEAAGGRHSLNPAGAKSRQVTPDELVAAQPERIIICPCGYGLEQIRRELPSLTRQPWWNHLPAVQSGRIRDGERAAGVSPADSGGVVMVDGSQMFNRPGPRLVEAFRWLVGWLNDRPELVPDDFPAEFI